MHDGYGFTGGGLFVVFLVLLLLFGALAALVVWAVTAHQAGTTSRGGLAPTAPALPPARLILDERLARGEIDDEEYRRRRAALEGGA